MLKRAVFAVLCMLLVPLGFAYGQSSVGCGPAKARFGVKSHGKHHTVATPAPEKALFVFLQDDLKYHSTPQTPTRFGLDGTWVGATHANSYFFVPVEPGPHDVCASWQARFPIRGARSSGAIHVVAAPGETYYFRAQDIGVVPSASSGLPSDFELKLRKLNPAEGKLLVSSFSLDSSHPANWTTGRRTAALRRQLASRLSLLLGASGLWIGCPVYDAERCGSALSARL